MDGLICTFLQTKQNRVKSKTVLILVSFHKFICLLMTKAHCLRNFPFQLKPVNMKCKLRTKPWTMDWHSSVRTDHKILNDEAHSVDQYITTHGIPWIPQNVCGRD